MAMTVPLKPVRGWEKRMPPRGVRCLLGRHKPVALAFYFDGAPWRVVISVCSRCKRPVDAVASKCW